MIFPALEEKRTPFLMEIEEASAAKEDGVLVIGKVKTGNIMVGDEVEVIGFSSTVKHAVVAAQDVLFPGTLLLQGLTKGDFIRGQVLATPGIMKPYTLFWAHVIFSPAQACVDPQPFLGTFRSLFHIRGADIYGTMQLPEETTALAPGDQVNVQIELQQPSALEIGLSFHIDRRMGSGTVTKLLG